LEREIRILLVVYWEPDISESQFPSKLALIFLQERQFR